MFKKFFRKKKKTTIRHHLVASSHSKSVIAEQYRTIRTNIEYTAIDKEMKSILVTSAAPGDGKSTTSCNLAIVFAQQGKNVLLIDADLRKPTMHYTFNVTNTYGLTNVLTRRMDLGEAVEKTEVENLDILSSGPIPPNPAELLGSKAMDELLKQLRTEYSTIIIDTPPLMAVADAQILASKCDGSILVINSGKTVIDNVLKSKEKLTSSSARILGTILNNKKIISKQDIYYYYGN